MNKSIQKENVQIEEENDCEKKENNIPMPAAEKGENQMVEESKSDSKADPKYESPKEGPVSKPESTKEQQQPHA